MSNEIPESILQIPIHSSWKDLEHLAMNYLAGKDIEKGPLKISFQQIELGTLHNKLVINAKTAGTFDGTVQIKTLLDFNKATNKFELSEMELELESKNIFQRGLAGLFKNTILNQLEKALEVDLDTYLDPVLKQVNPKLSELLPIPEVLLNGELKQLSLIDFSYHQAGVAMEVRIKGNIQAQLKSPQMKT